MKIQPAKIESFLKGKEYLNYAALLIYGQDSGAVNTSFKKIESSILPNPDDPFLSAKLDSGRIAEEPTIIFDELSAISFGGGRRLVTIKNAEGKDTSEAIIAALEEITPDIEKNSFLLVTAGELPATSALRKFFEAGKNTATLTYYLDDERSLSIKAAKLLREKNISFEGGVCDLLADLCQGDSMILVNEVEKLSLYLGERKNLSMEDVILATGNSSETSLQDICNAVFAGNKEEVYRAFRTGGETGVVPIAIIRSLQKYLEKLEYSYEQIRSGKSEEQAISSLRPPVFFKQVPVFKAHLRRVAVKNNYIKNAYHLLYSAESQIKESGAEPEMITERLLQKLAS